jgi:gliding motility-associated-like protein
LQANPGQANYQWNPNGPQATEWTVYESGTYTLTAFDLNGCSKTSAPVTVQMVPNNVSVPQVLDTAVCPGGFAILTASAVGTVSWYDDAASTTALATGYTFTTPELTEPRTYFADQKAGLCRSEKVPVEVLIDDCEGIEISNAFTPDGDGINDVFYFPQKGGKCFLCQIYDRWGRLLYHWSDAYAGWDGTIQPTGAKVNDGVYYYVLNYCDFEEKQTRDHGFIHVFNSRSE